MGSPVLALKNQGEGFHSSKIYALWRRCATIGKSWFFRSLFVDSAGLHTAERSMCMYIAVHSEAYLYGEFTIQVQQRANKKDAHK